MSDAFDRGCDLFRAEPELYLMEVHRKANAIVATYEEVLEFVDGYVTSRKRRWEFQQERVEVV